MPAAGRQVRLVIAGARAAAVRSEQQLALHARSLAEEGGSWTAASSVRAAAAASSLALQPARPSQSLLLLRSSHNRGPAAWCRCLTSQATQSQEAAAVSSSASSASAASASAAASAVAPAATSSSATVADAGLHAGGAEGGSSSALREGKELRPGVYPSKAAQKSLATTKSTKVYKQVRKGARWTGKMLAKASGACVRILRKTGKLSVAFVRDPRVVYEWGADIKVALKHFFKWIKTGSRLFRKNAGASFWLIKRVAQGHHLKVREKQLLIRTTADCMKIIPFSLFIIVPFAELLLPFALRLFPNMMPSTFFEQQYDNATLAKKFKAKQQMASFMQEVIAHRTQEILKDDVHDLADKAQELKEFEEKLMDGDFPTMKEILRFSKLFKEEWGLVNATDDQLIAMSKLFGLPSGAVGHVWPAHLRLQLRHHMNHLRREDRDYLWEGIEGLHHQELIEACKKRAIRFHDTSESQMRRDLARWLELSANRNIPTPLLIWIQSFHLKVPEGGSDAGYDSDFGLSRTAEPVLEEQAKPVLEDPREAFHAIAERRKAKLDAAEHKLEDLEHEVEEMKSRQDEVEETKRKIAEEGYDSCSEEQIERLDENERSSDDEMVGPAAELQQAEKRKLIKRLDELQQDLVLHKAIAEKQKLLLDHQIDFLTHMRDNQPNKNQDAGRILLDQRVRLVEMMNTFESDTAAIELLLFKTDDVVDQSKSGEILSPGGIAADQPFVVDSEASAKKSQEPTEPCRPVVGNFVRLTSDYAQIEDSKDGPLQLGDVAKVKASTKGRSQVRGWWYSDEALEPLHERDDRSKASSHIGPYGDDGLNNRAPT